ncbi:MAG: alpha/beta hydrolase [Clostridia bacterium]|nr:alpha/beta hydrolase [Clostridia bacterium]
MQILWWILGVIAFIAVAVLAVAFGVFIHVFWFKSRKPLGDDEFEIPVGDIYEVYREDMINWVKAARTLPHEDFEIKSYDGLTLRGRYYECKKGAPMEILVHGYEGNSERDLSGGIERCFKLGRNALVVDQRAAGRSDGHIATFGIRERKDCRKWIDFCIEHFGNDVKIGITGVSMGAATVMMTAGVPLPDNVKFVLADCGYSSAKEIICKVISEMGLPVKLSYPFVKLGARLYGNFDIEEYSPLQAMQNCSIPVLFVHGDTDAFVPYSMSVSLYNACKSEKKALITIKGAGHGLAYPVARDEYVESLRRYDKEWGLNCAE